MTIVERLIKNSESLTFPEGATRDEFIKFATERLFNAREYAFEYELWKRDSSNFISRKAVQVLSQGLHKLYPKKDNPKDLLSDKLRFNEFFAKLGLVNRKFMEVGKTTTGLIGKPRHDSWGRGVSTIYLSNPNRTELVEERIKNCFELARFHQNSLNTVRVITIRHGNKAEIFGSQFRMGVGHSCIDNCHSGGIYSEIDLDTGKTCTPGIDKDGKRYITHPNTHIEIKNTIIPLWKEIKEKSILASMNTDNIITGWDIAVTNDYRIEFIEGNGVPDFDMVQTPRRLGCKNRLYDTLNRVLDNPGIDYDKLIKDTIQNEN